MLLYTVTTAKVHLKILQHLLEYLTVNGVFGSN